MPCLAVPIRLPGRCPTNERCNTAEALTLLQWKSRRQTTKTPHIPSKGRPQPQPPDCVFALKLARLGLDKNFQACLGSLSSSYERLLSCGVSSSVWDTDLDLVDSSLLTREPRDPGADASKKAGKTAAQEQMMPTLISRTLGGVGILAYW